MNTINFEAATENTFIVTGGGMVVTSLNGEYVRGFEATIDLFDEEEDNYADNVDSFLLLTKEEADALAAELSGPAVDWEVMSAAEWQQRTGCDYLADRIYTALENQQ